MRVTLLMVCLCAVLGCNQGYNFDQAVAKTQEEMTERVRPLDTTKPPPKVPLPENRPQQIDIQKVNSESAKITALKVEDVAVGSGPLLEPGKYASVHYVGMLPDNYVFHTTYENPDAQPFTFLYDPIKPQVIEGWIQGMKGMRVGGHRRLTIPAAMAYGPNPPAGSPIPPNAALVFEVVLMFVGDSE
jgi:FKBP-type peptidyl-prolyl cis-trans isomerase